MMMMTNSIIITIIIIIIIKYMVPTVSGTHEARRAGGGTRDGSGESTSGLPAGRVTARGRD